MPEPARLVFVYNVDGTPLALLGDFIHRIREPETYPCSLCDLTYGRFMKKSAWGAFVAQLPLRARFHLKNVFRRRHPDAPDVRLPAVFVESTDGTLRELISADEIDDARDLEALQRLVTRKVATLERRAAAG